MSICALYSIIESVHYLPIKGNKVLKVLYQPHNHTYCSQTFSAGLCKALIIDAFCYAFALLYTIVQSTLHHCSFLLYATKMSSKLKSNANHTLYVANYLHTSSLGKHIYKQHSKIIVHVYFRSVAGTHFGSSGTHSPSLQVKRAG